MVSPQSSLLSRAALALLTVLSLIAICALLFGWAAFGQTTTTPTMESVTGNLSGVGSTSDVLQVRFSLVNCGVATPTVPGVTVIVPKTKVFTADSSGNFAGQLWGNDQIACNLGFTTLYQVTYLRNNVPVGQPQDFRVTNPPSPWSLTAATPTYSLPPVNVAASGFLCHDGTVLVGIQADWTPICGAPGAVGAPSGTQNTIAAYNGTVSSDGSTYTIGASSIQVADSGRGLVVPHAVTAQTVAVGSAGQAAIDQTGNATVTSLTCTSLPCGVAALTVPGANQQVLYNSNGALGAVAGFKFDGTTLQAPSIGLGVTDPTYQLNIQQAGQTQAYIGTTSNSSYAVLRLGTPSQVWQFATGGSATGGTAGSWYVYDQTAGATQLSIAAGTGNATFRGLLQSPSIATGSSGRAQIAAGGSGGYSNFTLNGNNTDGGRIGFIGGGGTDPNLYLDVTTGGVFRFRANNVNVASLDATGLQVTSLTCTSTPCGAGSSITGPQYRLGAFNGTGSGSAYQLGNVNISTDATGNNLTVPGVMVANQPQGMWSATAYNTGGNGANTNGLQTILANPTYQGQASSSILVEPGYTEWEQSPLAIMTGDRRSVFDTREGSFYLLSRNPGATGTHSNSNIYMDCAAHTMPSATFGSITTEFNSNCLWANYKNDVPGYYNGAIDPAQPTGWASATFLNANVTFYGAAINKSLFSANLTAQGAGDQQVIDLHNYDNYGGGDKSADEGHHLFRIVDTVGAAYFVGSVGSVADDPTDDYYTLALNSSNGQIGVLRLLLNTTTGVIADTIQGSSVPGTGGRLITMAASTYPVSKVATLTSGDIAPPKNAYQTKTTASITLSTAVDLSTVTPSLVGQGMMLVTNNNTDSMECMPIQSIGAYNSSTQSQTVTTMANEHHSNGATAYLGGMACKFLVADADVMARTGNNKPTVYVLGSTANNTLLVARQVGGSPDSWTPAGGTVHIYNGGRVLDVRDPNGYSTANTLKVERTGTGIWHPNDGLYSGMISTSQNDTIYYALTDNNPYSGGSSVLYSLNGAQAGGYGARDFMRVQNNAHDSDYTYGGGPFTMGYLIHSMGPVGGIFKADLPFHDAFLTQFNCGYDFAKSASASFAERCANSGRGPNGALLAEGWDVKGDFEVVPFQNASLWTAIFSYVNGIQLNQFTSIQGTDGPGTASLKVLAPLNGTGVAFWNAGKGQTDGAATFGSTVTTNGQLFATGGIVLGQHNCILGTDLNGIIGCNSNPISGTTFTGTRYDLQYNGTTVGQVTNNLSTFQVQSTNGSTFALAASGQLRLSANAGTGFGSGGIRFDTYLAGGNGGGMVIRSNSDNGNTGSVLSLQVSDFNTNAFQTILQANGVTTSGAHAGISLAPNGGTVTLGGDLATLHDTLASGATCGTHAANAIWADDAYVYHCNAAGTAASRAALSTY